MVILSMNELARFLIEARERAREGSCSSVSHEEDGVGEIQLKRLELELSARRG